MEITFHSLFYILTSWLLMSSTFGDIALQPGFDQPGQGRHLFPNVQPNSYPFAYQPHQVLLQPSYGQSGQTPYNFQSLSFPPSPNPWMMGYRPYQQFGPSGLPGLSPSFPTASNQFQSRGLDAELQRARELQQKLIAHLSGFSQSNSAQLPQQQAVAPAYPSPNVPYYSFYPPYMQSPNNLRAYRSLPILQTHGYQIINLRDLQNPQQQRAWSNPVDSRFDSGINPQTYNSQHHEMATNSPITLSQLELNTPEFNKKIDDDIVGSPLQIYKSQSFFNEQHHPVEMVNIPDDFYIPNNTSKAIDNIDTVKENSPSVSKIIGQMNSNSSNENGNFPQENSQQIEKKISYVDKPTTKSISEEVKSQSVQQHSIYKDYAISSGANANDVPITNIQYPLLSERINYNQPQLFQVGVSSQSNYVPKMDSINSQTSKIPSVSNYQSKADNDFYNSYKDYPSTNVLASPKFPFSSYNLDNPYNTAINVDSKEPALWKPPGLSATGYVPSWNNFGTEYYQQ